MNHPQSISRLGVSALFIGLSAAFLTTILGPARATQAALVENGQGPQLLIGLDDDTQENTAVQAGATANQSLNRTGWFRQRCDVRVERQRRDGWWSW
jgi:hypothetical protein